MMRKRLLASFLALVMLAGLFPIPALAAEPDNGGLRLRRGRGGTALRP